MFLSGAVAALLPAQDWRHSEAFHRLYNLDFDSAIALLKQDAAKDPKDPDHHNNLAYAILYRALFSADALEGGVALSVAEYLRRSKVAFSAEERQRFHAALGRAEAAANALGESPASLYALGVSQTHRANLALLVDKEWRPALQSGGEARKLHARALELKPDFVDAMLVPSFHEYIVGSLPFYLKALGFLVGFSGNKDKGLEGLRQVAAKGLRAKLEAQVLLALVEQREDHPERGVPIMRELVKEFPSNHLYRREYALLLVASKRREEARREFAELANPKYRFLKPGKLADYRRDFEAKLRA